MIYIVCPQHKISGGPEALHQLCYYMNKQGIEAAIAYVGEARKNPIPKPYKKYGTKYVFLKNITDKSEVQLIFPEYYVGLMRYFKKSNKSVWWLSVDNFKQKAIHKSPVSRLKVLLKGILLFDKFRIYESILPKKAYDFDSAHINYVGSYYAENDLKIKEISNIKKLIEPVGLDFIKYFHTANFDSNDRKNWILYNPAKDKEIIQSLIKNYPEFEFKAIKGMTHEQIADLFKISKLYIDFGPFPGPERLPKEAVAMGCCVITGRRGASNFYGDVRIPDEYKIEDTSDLKLISEKIKKCLNHYNEIIHEFEDYRQMVYNLEENFQNQIKEYFT